MKKVSLYIRNHSSRKYEKAQPRTIYPMGTIFVLRYGTTWETLRGDHTYQTAKTAAMNKDIEFFNGTAKESATKKRPKPDARSLDALITIYLTSGKSAKEHYSYQTVQCYTMTLKTLHLS